MSEQLKILIIGSGGREHALLRACLASPLACEVIVAPGNGGMAADARCIDIDPDDIDATVKLAINESVDLVIIGPEVPLANGMADALRLACIDVFGPGKAGARLESSKADCKRFFDAYNIPTAGWERFNELEPALAWLQSCNFPVVVKASGLAAGKGVIICPTATEARDAVHLMLQDKAFGSSGDEIVIEEFLHGEEASLMVIISGKDYVCLPACQDHKRIGEGDRGPNTGGMGAYAPASVADPEVMRKVRERIILPTLHGFAAEKIDYRGVLFIGLMIHAGEPKVLEFNVRFGDPECQVLLPLFASDPLAMMRDCARGVLEPASVRFHPGSCIIVVLAANGYPASYPKGDIIELPDILPGGTHVIHAGTRRDEVGNFLSNGGRVLGVVAEANDLQTAAANAYTVCDAIRWQSKYYRRDIGHRELNR